MSECKKVMHTRCAPCLSAKRSCAPGYGQVHARFGLNARQVEPESVSLYHFESVSLFVLGYHWLPLATIHLVGDNKEFEVSAIF